MGDSRPCPASPLLALKYGKLPFVVPRSIAVLAAFKGDLQQPVRGLGTSRSFTVTAGWLNAKVWDFTVITFNSSIG